MISNILGAMALAMLLAGCAASANPSQAPIEPSRIQAAADIQAAAAQPATADPQAPTGQRKIEVHSTGSHPSRGATEQVLDWIRAQPDSAFIADDGGFHCYYLPPVTQAELVDPVLSRQRQATARLYQAECLQARIYRAYRDLLKPGLYQAAR